MLRTALISLALAVPAYAATVPQMDECAPVHTSPHQSVVMGQIKPHGTVWSCDWLASIPNPIEYDPWADLKGPREIPAAGLVVPVPSAIKSATQASDPVPVLPHTTHGAVIGSHLFTERVHTRGCKCGCCAVPPPSPGHVPPVPLPAGVWLLAGAIGLLFARKGLV